VVVDLNQGIDEDIASAIQAAGKEKVKIRSVLTCESRRGVCALCYGRNLGSGAWWSWARPAASSPHSPSASRAHS